MTIWLWILIGCCAAALLLLGVSALVVLSQLRRLKLRAEAIAGSQLPISGSSMKSLQEQAARLSRIGAQVQAMTVRARSAIGELRSAFRQRPGS